MFFSYTMLFTFTYKQRIDDNTEAISLPPMNKAEVIEELMKVYNVNKSVEELSKYRLDELKYILKWFINGESKSNICMHVQALFAEEGRLIEI